MKITLAPIKPRNPLLVASLQRSAGSHRKSNGALRQRATRALQEEMKHAIQRAGKTGPPEI
jgi:hypothetical protein